MAEPTPHLSREFVERQRERLEGLRRQLLGAEQTTLARDRTRQEEHGAEVHDLEDSAQEMARQEIAQALHDVDEPRLQAIERALQKIEQGTYGFSDLSGAPIPLERLVSTPEAFLTLDEERRQEVRRPPPRLR
jgi:DnaK suppressor protein